MKTVKEWFEFAREAGHEWVDDAVENCPQIDKWTVTHASCAIALKGAFAWNNTPQGFDYWERVHKALLRLDDMSIIAPWYMDEVLKFAKYLTETLVPDLRDSGSDATADDFETAAHHLEQLIQLVSE